MRRRFRLKDKDRCREIDALQREVKVIQMKMDNIQRRLGSVEDGLHGPLEAALKGGLKKCMKEIQENIDFIIGALKALPEWLEVKL